MALKYTPIGGKFGPLVDAKCNTKQQQNLAKKMNKNNKQTMPKVLVSSHSSKKLKA